MAIQIIGLRDYVHPKTGKQSKRHAFIKEGWRLNSIQEVFGAKGQELIERIPAGERWNIYYTVADCFEDTHRKIGRAHV